MEDVIIPGWVWGLGTVVVFGWMIYFSLMAFRLKENSRVSDERDVRILSDLNRLETKIDGTKTDMHKSLEKLDYRFEKFDERMDKVFELAIGLIEKATKK